MCHSSTSQLAEKKITSIRRYFENYIDVDCPEYPNHLQFLKIYLTLGTEIVWQVLLDAEILMIIWSHNAVFLCNIEFK